jgi:tol-pal system protein YbgF
MRAAAYAAGLCIATAVWAQDRAEPFSVFDRIFGRDAPANAPEQVGQDFSRVPAAELVLRIERLEAQIRQLTGTIEQLQHRNQQLENQLRAAGGAVGAQSVLLPQPPRGSIQPGSAPAVPLPPAPASVASTPPEPASSQPASPATGRRSDAFDPTQNPSAPGAPRVLGSISSAPPPIITAEPPSAAPAGRGAGSPLDLSTLAAGAAAGQTAESARPPAAGPLPPPPARNLSATGAVASVAPPSESPQDYYDLAYGYMQRKDYAQAEDSFQAFLKKFPNDRRAADAQFWLGESLFQRQRHDAAAQAFLDLSTKYTSHGKAPDALLRLAQSLAALKQKEMACATLAEVGRKYPRASNNVKQGVEREQKRVQC